jgi:hypothetical protein
MTPKFPVHPGMITSDEENLILQIVRDTHNIDDSCFVEIGPWLGKSSYCILDGLRPLDLNTNLDLPKLLCFDRFRWSSMYAEASKKYSDFISYYSLNMLTEGDCFQDAFDKIMADHVSGLPVMSSKMEASDISLTDFTSFAGDRHISAFFIDASKNWEDNYSVLSCISSYMRGQQSDTILYLQDALHPTAYRLLNLIVLSQGFSWYGYSSNSGTALAIRVHNDFKLPSHTMNDYDISYLFSAWNGFRGFLGADHHYSEMVNLALASFLIFTDHHDAARSIASEALREMNAHSISLYERLAGSKVVKQFKSLNLI